MTQSIRRAARLNGTVTLPADKSIAHRAALLSALADGTSEIIGFPSSADPQSTLHCLRGLGIGIDVEDESTFVHGRGLRGLTAPREALYCGNSGTTMRLLAGILAGQPFASMLTGDESLSRRPMGRVVDPLRLMGAVLEMRDGKPPLNIRGKWPLKPIEYTLPVPSAQVKSCILLAGLFADGITTVVESLPSRDHTERMLQLTSLETEVGRILSIEGGQAVPAQTWHVPCDFSAAAFFLVAASILPDSDITLPGVGLNPTRTGLLDVLRTMGADIVVENERSVGGEPIGDLNVRSSPLHGVRVDGALIPRLIDEIPILAVAAAVAEGRTEICDAEELRVKETDRIAAMATNLRSMGADVDENPDGLVIVGPSQLRGTTVSSEHDHRIAMSMAIAGMVASGETVVEGAEIAAVSFPSFWEVIRQLQT